MRAFTTMTCRLSKRVRTLPQRTSVDRERKENKEPSDMPESRQKHPHEKKASIQRSRQRERKGKTKPLRLFQDTSGYPFTNDLMSRQEFVQNILFFVQKTKKHRDIFRVTSPRFPKHL